MPSFLALALFAPLTQRVLLRLRPAYQPLWALRHTVVAERISLRTFATFGEALRPCLTRCITAALRAAAFVPSHWRSRALLLSQAAQRPARPRWCTGAVRAARWPASGRAAARRAMAGTRARPAPARAAPSSGAAAERQLLQPVNPLSFSVQALPHCRSSGPPARVLRSSSDARLSAVRAARLEKEAIAASSGSGGGGGGVAAARAAAGGAQRGLSRVGQAPPATRPRLGGWVAETMQRARPPAA